MSQPRCIVADTSYLLTRRCIGRQFLLKPSTVTNQTVLYCLAVASERYDVRIHAVCVMGNHYHLVATDTQGNLPEFMRYLNEFVAKAMNAHWGRWESFFAPGSYSAVTLTDEATLMDKTVYTVTNPVDAMLVDTHTQWPGLLLYAGATPEPHTVNRPDTLFRKTGPMPEQATLTLYPPEMDGMDATAFADALTQRVADEEAILCKRVRGAGKTFLGRRNVLRQRHTDTPKTREPRRTLNPRIAGRDRHRRCEALRQLKTFLADYRQAWQAFRDGTRNVLFPKGTYAMVHRHGVACVPSG